MANRLFSGQFEWLKALPLLMVTGALAIIALGALAGAQSPDARSREALFSFFQRLSPADYDVSEGFQIVMIDRESVERVGPWPWPRTVLADIVESAGAAGAKGVVLVEPMDAPDPLSPETIGEFWLEGASDDVLAAQLARLPETDEVLANAFTPLRGAIGVAASSNASTTSQNQFQRADAKRAPWLNLEEGGAEFLALPGAQFFYGLNSDLSRAASPAVAALVPDSDGVVRRTPLLWALDEMPTPSIALEAARLAGADDDAASINARADASSANAAGRFVREISVNGANLPINRSTTMRVHLPKRLDAPKTSASRLLDNRSNEQLKGAVVFIGLDTDLGPSVSTPRGSMAPVELHALTAAQISSGQAPARAGWLGYIEALGVMIFGAAAVMTAQRMQFWQAIGFAGVVSAILLLGALMTFAFSNMLVNPLPPAAAMFIGALSVAGGRSIGGVMRDDNFRGSFHDTLPEPAMKMLREESGADILAGARRDITVLACELRILEEDLRTMQNLPDDVTKLMAAASLDLRQTIIDTGGVADQAEGGRLFAYYNAPIEAADHQQAACAAALRLVESMDKINEDLEASSRTRNLQIHLGIGIATGECFIGPMGHGRNNRYSAIGPAVDRASFLRQQSEFYGPAMIVDESVHRQTHHHFAYLELDMLKTRDGERPFSIFALIGNPFIKSSKGFRELDEHHRGLLTAYRAGDAAAASEMLARAKQSPGAKIALFDIYEKRISAMAEHGAPENWDGAHTVGV